MENDVSPDALEQYNAALNKAALFDSPQPGMVKLVGPEAGIFLHNLCTNDVKDLPVGAGCEAFLTTAKARVVAHIRVGHFDFGDHTGLLLDFFPRAHAGKVMEHLNHYLISEQVEISDESMAQLHLLHLSGPDSLSLTEKVLGQSLAELPELHHRKVKRNEAQVYLRRHDPLEVPGLDLIGTPQAVDSVRQALLREGAVTAGPETYEILRIEAGTPEYDKDIDEQRFVVEIGRPRAISYTKGCYLGQEPIVMARDRGHVNRRLMGVRLEGDRPVQPRARLFREGREIGVVTSSTVSPRFGPIALAYIHRDSQSPGIAVTVEPDSDGREAKIAALPFVPE